MRPKIPALPHDPAQEPPIALSASVGTARSGQGRACFGRGAVADVRGQISRCSFWHDTHTRFLIDQDELRVDLRL